MKTKILLLFIISVFCMKSYAQISTETLQQLFNNGEYEKAISYVSNFENGKDDKALYILGNCYFERAAQIENLAIQLYNQSIYNESMAMSMGLYIDNSWALNLYNQNINDVLQKRLKAIELYSKSSNLGNANAYYKLQLIGTMYGTSTPSYSNNSQTNTGTTYKSSQSQKCGYCNGTGHVNDYVATYGNTEQKWCAECGKYMSAGHCHGCKICPSCGGKGSK